MFSFVLNAMLYDFQRERDSVCVHVCVKCKYYLLTLISDCMTSFFISYASCNNRSLKKQLNLFHIENVQVPFGKEMLTFNGQVLFIHGHVQNSLESSDVMFVSQDRAPLVRSGSHVPTAVMKCVTTWAAPVEHVKVCSPREITVSQDADLRLSSPAHNVHQTRGFQNLELVFLKRCALVSNQMEQQQRSLFELEQFFTI